MQFIDFGLKGIFILKVCLISALDRQSDTTFHNTICTVLMSQNIYVEQDQARNYVKALRCFVKKQQSMNANTIADVYKNVN